MTVMEADAKPSTWRSLLRDRTLDAHIAAEQHWSTAQGFASLERYCDFLRCAQHAHLAYGLPAARAIGHAEDLDEERSRATALLHDLGPAPEVAETQLDMTESFAWGASYVLNGSVLGASLMLRSDHVWEHWPKRYLETCRAYAKSGNLKRFFDRMNNADVDIETAAHGAEEIFAIFTNPRDEQRHAQD